MPLDAAIARINEIQTMINPSLRAAQVGGAAAPPTGNFQTTLAAQMTSIPATSNAGAVSLLSAATPPGAPASVSPQGGVGEKIVALARQELARNVVEDPPGSNDSPDIARYRTATEGAMSGQPWCAYFVSYIAKQAGVPIGDYGQGMGLVDNITDWAQRTGRFIPTSGQPQPGDLALFDEHIGIVETVGPDGNVILIEGNSSDRVQRVDRSISELIGFARLG